MDEALDHQRAAALVVDVLLEDEAAVGAGLDGRAHLDYTCWNLRPHLTWWHLDWEWHLVRQHLVSMAPS